MIPQAAHAPLGQIAPSDEPSVLDDSLFGLLGEQLPEDDLWLGRSAPRYTSYPPATAFRDDMGPQEYASALDALPKEEPVSLYLHVPFCQSLCLYCACQASPTRQHDRVSSYLNALLREMEHLCAHLGENKKLSRVHFGGGSPNIMSEKDMGLVFGTLARRFDLSTCDEIAMEMDPRLITKAQARALTMTGVSRVSLGIQDFDPNVQAAIGRVQPFEEVEAAVGLLREHGVKHLSFDLLYGLPLQTPASMAETARRVIALKPDRVSLFSYAHVPSAKPHQKALEQYILPTPYACLALERAARGALREAGYVEIGMDHFARPKDSLTQALWDHRLHRSFQGYTDDQAQTLLGLGASSIGHMPHYYFQNARATEAYQERIAGQRLATARGLRLTSEDRVRAAIIEELMVYLSVNVETICRAHHFSPAAFAAEMEALTPFVIAGIVKRHGYRISLAVPHRMAVRVVAALFDSTPRAENAPVSRVV